MSKILVTGINGQLGKSIHKLVTNTRQTDDFIFVGREELDLSKNKSIVNYFNNNKFDIIINCAAYTAVDRAEEEVELANQVNHIAVKLIAEIARKQKTRLIHISTDYVFDGESDKPYIETDATNPVNVYGKTKLAGEKALQEAMPTNAIIIRVSWLYSEFGNNFVEVMLRLGNVRDEINVVSDQMGSPTYATDLAETILTLVNNKGCQNKEQSTEIYHYSNKGEISWYDFAKEIFKIVKIDCKVNSINMDQYPTPAKRPRNTLMDKDKIRNKLEMSHLSWSASLEQMLRQMK
jgi:dTDP-4-dehydrorhamnose reductase